MAKTGQDQNLKLSLQTDILFLKVFFDKKHSEPPGRQISMAGTLEVLPSTPKIGAESCPPSRKGPPFLILCRYDINRPRPTDAHKYNEYKIVSV